MNEQDHSHSIANIRYAKNYSGDYVVSRSLNDDEPTWFFQVMKSKLMKLSMKGPFNIVVICDIGAPSQVVFSIPYAYFKENIEHHAHLEANGRYLFNVNKVTYEFNWSRNVKMDGKKFLAK